MTLRTVRMTILGPWMTLTVRPLSRPFIGAQTSLCSKPIVFCLIDHYSEVDGFGDFADAGGESVQVAKRNQIISTRNLPVRAAANHPPGHHHLTSTKSITRRDKKSQCSNIHCS